MRRATGFSLLEVLLALVLLTLLLLGVYSGVRTATHSVRSGTATVQRLDQVRSAQHLLRQELAQAMVAPIGRDANGDSIYFKGAGREMSFVAPLPGYLGKLGPQMQTLSLVDDGKGGLRLQLQLALLPPDGKPPKPLGKPQVLLDHIHSGSFEYRGVDARGQPGEQASPQGGGLEHLGAEHRRVQDIRLHLHEQVARSRAAVDPELMQ